MNNEGRSRGNVRKKEEVSMNMRSLLLERIACISTAILSTALWHANESRSAPPVSIAFPRHFFCRHRLANHRRNRSPPMPFRQRSSSCRQDTATIQRIKGLHMRCGIMGGSPSVQHTFFATDRAAVAAESMVPAFRDGWNGSKRSAGAKKICGDGRRKGKIVWHSSEVRAKF